MLEMLLLLMVSKTSLTQREEGRVEGDGGCWGAGREGGGGLGGGGQWGEMERKKGKNRGEGEGGEGRNRKLCFTRIAA